jgi:two-component system sensor histidine kinase QseC
MDSSARYSLKHRLLLGLLACVAVVWVATSAYSYFDTRHEINELLDAHLAQSASLIVAQLGHDVEEIDLEHAPATDKRARRVAFQIWERGTLLRLHSVDAPPSRLAAREEGYSVARIDGKGWRVFSTWDAGHRLLVQIAERDEARRDIAVGIATNLLVPLLVALPILAAFVWLTVGRAVTPLDRLGQAVEQRKPDNLAVIALADAPREVIPLVRSLNALFDRVGRLIENERRFTSDAAHELRTPLAGLKAQAQVAKSASDDGVRQHALDRVIEGCDRATRLVDQLLTLARLEPDTARPAGLADLAALARAVAANLAPFAVGKGVEIEVRGSEALPIEGHPDLLSVLLRNIMDNAIRYSPRGSTVSVDIERAGNDARVTVSDQGPGIAPQDRARLGQRFYRVVGNAETGSGLGLSIVRRIAEIHHAELRLQDGEAGPGLRVLIDFRGRAATPSSGVCPEAGGVGPS